MLIANKGFVSLVLFILLVALCAAQMSEADSSAVFFCKKILTNKKYG